MTAVLTAEQKAIRQVAREFADHEIRPHVMEWDEAQHFPKDVFRKLGELGFLGTIFPEKYGGAGLSYMDYIGVIEEIAAVDGSVGLSLAAHTSLGTNHIYQFGTEEQRQRYIPKLAGGEWLAAWGLTEAEAGSDSGGTRSTAVRDGGSWILNGSKNFTTNASVGQVAVLMAVTDRTSGRHGISSFIVELDNPGIRVGKKENKLGMRASDTCTLVMEDCRIPAENLLGAEGSGFVNSMKILDGGRISIAALAVGMARGAWQASLAYAKERKQFGRPIAEFEMIQWKIVRARTQLDAGRLLVHRAAALADCGKPFSVAASKAKLYATEAASRAANDCLQILGGYGYLRDYPVERIMRDARLMEIGEGTSEVQRIVIARDLSRQAS